MPSPNTTIISAPTDVLLVLPAYRELRRLPQYLSSLVDALSSAPWSSALLVVDDGSPAGERRALFDQIHLGSKGHCQVLAPRYLEINRLKGDAILDGWKSQPSSWLAYCDADGATPAAEVLRVLGDIIANDSKLQRAYFGSRHGDFARCRRSPAKRFLSRAFSILTGLMLRVPSIDIQCGFKVVPGHILPESLGALTGRGLCFDIALYLALRAKRIPVRPVPISWIDQPGGRVSALRNGPGMLAGLWRLATRGLKPI